MYDFEFEAYTVIREHHPCMKLFNRSIKLERFSVKLIERNSLHKERLIKLIFAEIIEKYKESFSRSCCYRKDIMISRLSSFL